MRRSSKVLAMLIVIGLLVAVAGCGGGSSSTGNRTTGEAGEGGGSTSSDLTKVERNVEALLGPKGNSVEEPTTSPVRAGESKTIQLIPCGEQVGACASAVKSAEEAAQKLGWKTTVYDPKLNLPAAATGIRQAIAAGDDGIFIYYIDCTNVKTALEEAKKAGIPVVGAQGKDCNETESGAPELFTYTMEYKGGKKFDELNETLYHAQAEYPISHFEGESKALAFFETGAGSTFASKVLEEAYAECSGCSLEVVHFPPSAYGTRLQGIAEQELLKHPEVNTVIPAFEAPALEIYPAVRASGNVGEILFAVGEGGEAGLEIIREGNVNGYSVPFDVEWEGWAAMDALGRIFKGQKPVPIGLGTQLIDSEHNLPESGPAESPIDFKAMYEKAWKLR